MLKRNYNCREWIVSGLIMMAAGAALAAGSQPGITNMVLSFQGQTEYVIIQGADPAKAELLAIEELTNHLAKVTGAQFTVLSETQEIAATSGIYVGWTDFARQQGIDVKTLGEEEWIIRSAGKNLIITGGRPRGTLYAVYEFLERQAGCHWLCWDAEILPHEPDLTLPSLNLRGQPAFSPRYIYFDWGRRDGNVKTQLERFVLRNRGQAPWQPDIGEYLVLPQGLAHTFYFFVDPREWFDNHPEYFSMNREGKRFCGNIEKIGGSGSQLCLSNPDVARITAENISGAIKEKEKEFAEWGDLRKFRACELTQEDNASYICKCPECRKISEREGSESGLLIQYVNRVGELLSEEYPDIKLRTLCYVSTDKPPLTVKPRDNVIVYWADLYGKSDCYRPLTHPVNQGQAELLRGWAKIAKELHVWDYWNMGSRQSGSGVPKLISGRTIAADIRFFRDNHVTGIFIEDEMGVTQQSFYDLSYWVGMQLLNNPDLPEDKLLATFIHGYYGPAAKPMQEYYDFLANTLKQEPTPMYRDGRPVTGRKYLTMDFLVRCRDLLLKAESVCAPDSPEQMHVWREMIVVYNCLLHQWGRMKRITRRDFPFSRDEILDRYEAMRQDVINYQFGPKRQKELSDDLQREMTVFRSALPLPEQFRNLPEDKVMDFPWSELPSWEVREDPDATGGRAIAYNHPDPEKHKSPPAFGVYDRASKRSGPTLSITNIPADEKYHVYKIGKFRLGTDSIVQANWELMVYLSSAYIPADGVQGRDPNLWEVYVSAKITGPAYVPESDQTNAIWIDRVILVKPGSVTREREGRDKSQPTRKNTKDKDKP